MQKAQDQDVRKAIKLLDQIINEVSGKNDIL